MVVCDELPAERLHVYFPPSDDAAKKRAREDTRDAWVDKCSISQNAELDLLLAKAFYSGGIPHSFVDNPEFRKFLNHIRPAYRPPNRQRLSGGLLDSVHAQVSKQVEQKIREEAGRLTLTTDGWSNIRNEPVVNYILVSPSTSLFIGTDYNGPERHTKEFIAEGINNRIK
jgi:hypothetical protein